MRLIDRSIDRYKKTADFEFSVFLTLNWLSYQS